MTNIQKYLANIIKAANEELFKDLQYPNLIKEEDLKFETPEMLKNNSFGKIRVKIKSE